MKKFKMILYGNNHKVIYSELIEADTFTEAMKTFRPMAEQNNPITYRKDRVTGKRVR